MVVREKRNSRKPRRKVLKKVIIITYYWPPSGGSGVQRWLKMSKYLPQFGWEPIIVTPSNPEIPIRDDMLETEVPDGLTVIKQPIWEPYDLYRKLLGKKDEKIGVGLTSNVGEGTTGKNLGVWIRGNFFIPDPRKFWAKPMVKFLSDYMPKHGIDHVITTGPPHSMHLIGQGLKKKIGCKWIADFRDPWTGIYYYDDLGLTKWADSIHRRSEHKVLSSADRVVTVGPNFRKEFLEKGASKVDLVPNGFDPADYQSRKAQKSDGFTISFLGTFLRDQNHQALWHAIKQLVDENSQFKSDLKLVTVGQLDPSVEKSINEFDLNQFWTRRDPVPHKEIVQYQMDSDLLLLMINDTVHGMGIPPGKMYEYMAAGNPILCIGPKGADSLEIVKRTSTGGSFDVGDVDGIKRFISEQYSGKLRIEANPSEVNEYSRITLSGKIAQILDQL